MDNPRNKNQTIWWNMGIFLVNSPTSTFDVSTHSLSFEGLDLMAKLSDKRGGQLPAVTTIVPAGSKVADVVKQTITQLGGFDKYVIEAEVYGKGIVMWLFSQSSSIKVLSPPSLVEEMKEELRRLSNMYNL